MAKIKDKAFTVTIHPDANIFLEFYSMDFRIRVRTEVSILRIDVILFSECVQFSLSNVNLLKTNISGFIF